MFYNIGVSPVINAPMIIIFSEWTCLMYGRKKCTNVNNATLEIFLQTYNNNTITSVKKLDGKMEEKVRWLDGCHLARFLLRN